ncbi:MAG: SRPBCC family protein [Bacteroidota bacterium]
MSVHEYHFLTKWRLEASPEVVYRTLEDVEQLAVWWPSVYLDVKVLKPGGERGIGKEVALYTKGWLPYTLKWQFTVTEAAFPKGYSLRANGDFAGTGTWTFTPLADGYTEAVYDWRISAEKPILKYLSFLMKPLFSANHHWAMRKGDESLKLELQRRLNPDRIGQIPGPPPPTFPHNLTNNTVF